MVLRLIILLLLISTPAFANDSDLVDSLLDEADWDTTYVEITHNKKYTVTRIPPRFHSAVRPPSLQIPPGSPLLSSKLLAPEGEGKS